MKLTHRRQCLALSTILLASAVVACADVGEPGDEEALADTSELATSTNLALNKPVRASSVQTASLPASAAVDGSMASRWSSLFSDTQWIGVDLGSVMTVNHVVLYWETAYASSYQVQTSTDHTTWKTVFSTTSGAGGKADIKFAAVGARYVRMNGLKRATQWGYSLYELKVFNDAASPAPAPSPTTTGTAPAPAPAPVPAPTTTYNLYVSTTGSDSSSGTQSSPFRTIQHAAGVAKPDTTVHVAPGTYTGNVATSAQGSATGRIRYVSETKWGAKIVGTGTEATWTNNGSYTDVVGFDITGSGRLGILNYGSHTSMSGNHVHNLAVSGGCTGSGGAGIVNANYSSSDGDVIGNVVHDIGVPGACNGVQGIYSSNLRGHIYNNIVYRASSFGIHLWHAANNVIIANNTVFANGSSGMGGGIVIGTGDSPGGVVLDNTRVVNNVVYNNPATSIVEYCYSGQSCIGANNTIANNLVYGNGSGISLRVGSASGTITADPQFVNYQANGTGDYRLKSTSPGIDKGTSMYAPSFDIDNVARPRGAALDIGAYENY
ncbi:MAG: hypothetical protein JWP87_2178 [Labilithrix sp.]|nr:hypothetical protein [Labilithrix sp.]